MFSAAHAKLAPSGADTWMTCPGSVEAQDGLPDDTTEYAAEGTGAHEISDFCLTYDIDAYKLIGLKYQVRGTEEIRNHHGLITGRRERTFSYIWDEEDADFLQPGLDWLRAQPGDFYGEHKVDISNWLGDGQFGTLDRAIVQAMLERFIINDLKWGRGIPVSVRGTKQLRLYALGFWWNVARYFENIKSLLLVIDQPRSWIEGGTWEITLDELLEFGEEVRPAAERALIPGAERIPSKAGCHWCKRRKAPGGCYAYDEWMLGILRLTRAELADIEEIIMGRVLTSEERARIVQHSTLIENWMEKLEDDALQEALTTGESGGLKAIEGRKLPDRWKDPVEASEILDSKIGRARYAKPKLITPQQAVNYLTTDEDKAEVEAVITRGIKKPTLVPLDDKRPSIKSLNDQLAEMEDF